MSSGDGGDGSGGDGIKYDYEHAKAANAAGRAGHDHPPMKKGGDKIPQGFKDLNARLAKNAENSKQNAFKTHDDFARMLERLRHADTASSTEIKDAFGKVVGYEDTKTGKRVDLLGNPFKDTKGTGPEFIPMRADDGVKPPESAVTIRDRENRAQLKALTEAAKMYKEGVPGMYSSWTRGSAFDQYTKIQAVLDKYADRHPKLITFRGDNDGGSGSNAEFVITFGDVEHAKHVFTFTPGLNSGPDTADRYSQNVVDIMNQTGKKASVAGVLMQAYSPPNSGQKMDVAFGERINDGVNGLRSTLEFVKSQNPGADVTAVGHSYGGEVTARMAHHTGGGVVDRILLLGAAGSDVYARQNVEDPSGATRSATTDDYTAIKHGQAYNMSTPSDGAGLYMPSTEHPISAGKLLDRFGTNPDYLKGMNQLSTSKSGDHEASDTHDGYFKKNSTALYNIAAIVANTGKAIHAR